MKADVELSGKKRKGMTLFAILVSFICLNAPASTAHSIKKEAATIELVRETLSANSAITPFYKKTPGVPHEYVKQIPVSRPLDVFQHSVSVQLHQADKVNLLFFAPSKFAQNKILPPTGEEDAISPF